MVGFGIWSGNDGAASGGGGAYEVITGTTAAEIQAQVDAASDGTTFIFPAGTYALGGSIVVSGRTGLTFLGVGYGSVLQGAVTAPIFDISTSSAITIRQLRLAGDGIAGSISKTGIAAKDAVDDLTVDGCFIHDMGYDAVHVIYGATSRRLRVTNNTIWNCKDDGINPGGHTTATEADILDDVLIAGNFVRGITGDAVHVSTKSRRVVVVGNYLADSGCGVGFARASDATVTGNVISNCTRGVWTASTAISDVVVASNVITGGSYSIDFTSATSNLTITGNRLRGATTRAVRVANLTNGTIRGNDIDGTIEQGSGCTGLLIEHNRVTAAMVGITGDTIRRFNRGDTASETINLDDLMDVEVAGSVGDVLTRTATGAEFSAPAGGGGTVTTVEVLMTDGVTSPPEPIWTEAGDGWVYADGPVATAALSNNPFPSVLLVDQATTPTTPASGHVRLFVESGLLKFVDDTGAVTTIGS